ncbi:Protein EPIDERMAL PATTERNING FACTOR 1 [Hibiscus syriacus]|uniref:Epidermal patterning factor-like protein n=1 Tax=Hibiscus syriacus TaxID=106335 RepID=A0A6A2Y3D0_HIBSY|nr:protein EPIDERMAL PATTERNING FACTOR 1-like [Hibiscus syriacus]KAE8670126.1 Protein EPIDERMAL PATTERNING FACTOR 1 [Hibiscus syriacus]
MKPCVCAAAILVFLLLYVPVFTSARHARRLQTRTDHGEPRTREGLMSESSSDRRRSRPMMMKRKRADTLQVAGSRLPDCSHACGSCTPCRLVIVSFVCASQQEAETCPMAYKCMCNNKSYPVP